MVELIATIAISGLVFAALYQLLTQSLTLRASTAAGSDGMFELQFAMDRMVRSVAGSRLVLLPLGSDQRPLLAVTLAASVDRDGDGFADADDDRDGRIDEDPGADITDDGKPGIEGIDDDGDGAVDEDDIWWHNDDEIGFGFGEINEDPFNGMDDDGDGYVDEDWDDDLNDDGAPGLAGIDDDGDGAVDEGSNGDDDEDGETGEDWLNPVVYRLESGDLIERIPVPWDASGDGNTNGRDFVETVILNDVTFFEAQRVDAAAATVVHLTLTATDADGVAQTLSTTVRVGG